ncbi:MAG: hypothetical protein HKN47_12355 [Pirellulaceae bacterium]|nr:hypothetical protein [Pirellulaceae bacterium]
MDFRQSESVMPFAGEARLAAVKEGYVAGIPIGIQIGHLPGVFLFDRQMCGSQQRDGDVLIGSIGTSHTTLRRDRAGVDTV